MSDPNHPRVPDASAESPEPPSVGETVLGPTQQPAPNPDARSETPPPVPPFVPAFGATPPPAPHGAPVPPVAQPYPGAPPLSYVGAPAGMAPAPGGPGSVGDRPKTLAIVALVLAAVGVVMAFIPFVTWVSGAVLLAAFVVAIVALASKKQGGTGLGIAALVLSVVGWIVSIVVAIASFGLIADAARDTVVDDAGALASEAPEVDEEEPAEEVVDARQDLVVVESAFGRTSYDPTTWWYVVVLENPNADYIFDFAAVDVEAIDANGTILDTSSDYRTILNGRTAVAGRFLSAGQGEVTSLNVRGPLASAALSSPAGETGAFTIEGLAATTDSYSTSVTGTVSGTFDTEQEFVEVVVVARAADGRIIGAENAYIDRLPVGGGKVQFEARFLDVLPADTTFAAFAAL